MSERVVGVDGCRGGWLVCRLDVESQTINLLAIARSFEQILEQEKSARIIAIDIPIGLPEPGGARRCDLEARRLLTKVRASSVFPAPSRLFLHEPDHRSASAKSKQLCGKGIPAQAYAICAKIAEVDSVITPAMQDRVLEIHPELCFWAFTGGPMRFNKGTAAGYEERVAALANMISYRFPDRSEVRGLGLGPGIEPADLLDAVAAAITAARVLSRQAKRIPEVPEFDGRGLRMQMVC